MPASGENYISKNLRQYTGGESGLTYTELDKPGLGGLPPPGVKGSATGFSSRGYVAPPGGLPPGGHPPGAPGYIPPPP